VEIDGAILRVCQSCSRLGRPVSITPGARRVVPPRLAAKRDIEPELEIDPEYASIVRQAREKMGLTQEALGKMINVKPSVISHVETGKMKPDLVLARTLMHSLKVSLLVPSSDLDSNAR
jgi:putative transcription factor